MIWFASATILNQALIAIDGTIIEEHHPDSPRKHRGYFCTYIFKIADTNETVRYVAWGVDDSLPLDLPVGTKIEKKKWEIAYK